MALLQHHGPPDQDRPQFFDKQKVMASWTRQTRPRLLWGNPAPGLGPQPSGGSRRRIRWTRYYDQQDTSWKVRIAHDFIISPTLLNHFVMGGDVSTTCAPTGPEARDGIPSWE